jgi:uncharacterized heparinase superfamily protein
MNMALQEVQAQILTDGGHVSRSPAALAEALSVLVDIRRALMAAKYPVPEKLQHAIDRMSPALRFFRYADKGLALFHGARKGNTEFLDTLLVHANARGKALKSLPHSGYERITQGRSVLFMDSGSPAAPPYDKARHAAPLAFEFAHGKDRLFVNCGMHPVSEDWQDVLRGTAAHNTACINYRNAYEARHDGSIRRKSGTVTCERQESDDACLLDGSHDGYAALNGILHRRRLFLTQGGGKLSGEDSFTCSVGLGTPAEIALRFHLHPRASVSLTREGTEALILLPGGTGWRFLHRGGALSLEDSVYLGSGSKPRKTKQLSLTGMMQSDFAQIKWSLVKESN